MMTIKDCFKTDMASFEDDDLKNMRLPKHLEFKGPNLCAHTGNISPIHLSNRTCKQIPNI